MNLPDTGELPKKYSDPLRQNASLIVNVRHVTSSVLCMDSWRLARKLPKYVTNGKQYAQT